MSYAFQHPTPTLRWRLGRIGVSAIPRTVRALAGDRADARSVWLRLSWPARPFHVEPPWLAVGSDLQRRSLAAVLPEGFAFVAGQQAAVRVHDAPPRNAAAPERHHAADLPRSALPDELGDIAVRHDATRRDRLRDLKDPAREVADFSAGRPDPTSGCHQPDRSPLPRLHAWQLRPGATCPRRSVGVQRGLPRAGARHRAAIRPGADAPAVTAGPAAAERPGASSAGAAAE